MSDEYPEVMPGAWKLLPLDVRRMLTMKLVEKSLELHGAEGLIKFLYVGKEYPTITRPAGCVAQGREFWPYVVADTKLFVASRTPKPANPSGDATP